ncbi:MAG: hypothetical protein E7376_05105 [Clostridiales bacterium]|nr:hypothetical protein [Clostridiales bacterium]
MKRYCLLIVNKNLKYSDYFYNKLKTLLRNFKKMYNFTYLCEPKYFILCFCLENNFEKCILIKESRNFEKNIYLINDMHLTTLAVTLICSNFIFIGYNNKQAQVIKQTINNNFSKIKTIFIEN